MARCTCCLPAMSARPARWTRLQSSPTGPSSPMSSRPPIRSSSRTLLMRRLDSIEPGGSSEQALQEPYRKRLLLDRRSDVDEQGEDHQAQHHPDDDEDLVDLVVLLGEARALGVESAAAGALLQLGQFDTTRYDRSAVEGPFGGSNRGIRFQAHLDLAQAQDLPGFDYALCDFLAIDVSAIGGVQIPDLHLAAAQQHLAVVAGDGRLGNLDRVVFRPADGGLIQLQLLRAPGHSRTKQYQFQHKSPKPRDYGIRPVTVKQQTPRKGWNSITKSRQCRPASGR